MGKDSLQEAETVLVTGGLGFIGSHFVEMLLKKGHQVVNVDKVTYASAPNMGINEEFLRRYPNRYWFLRRDINDLQELPYCRVIVHLAAESHVDNSIRDSRIFMKSNVLGTKHLLDLMVRTRSKNISHDWDIRLPIFIYFGTDEVFGDRKEGYFREQDCYRPSNPYAASKAAAEMFVIAYGRTYGIPYKIVRTTNNYGPRQHPEKFVPSCVMNILRRNKVRIHGSGAQVRNWLHVEDSCQALYEIMIKGSINEIYHVSSEEELPVNEVARIVFEYFKRPMDVSTVEYVQDRSGQDLRYALDCSKMQNLGWRPKYTFNSSLPAIVRYYQKNGNNYH